MNAEFINRDRKRAAAKPDNTSLPGLHAIRPADPSDLDALVAIELESFETDRLSRRSFRDFISSPRAVLLVAAVDDKIAGYALVLFRKGTAAARLYSLAVARSARGRGLAGHLLGEAEKIAFEADQAVMRLESRADNEIANSLYRRAGYRPIARLEAYYEDGADGIRMERPLRGDAKPNRSPPYFEQTTEFTCGPACLMMAIAQFRPAFKLDEHNEIRLWRAATTIFMSSGIGGCEPYGLAVAAAEQGLTSEIFVNVRGPLLLETVKNAEMRHVMALAQSDFRQRAGELNVSVHYTPLSTARLVSHLEGGALAIILISGNRMFGKRVPHWVLAFDHDGRHIFIHDPWVEEEVLESATDAASIPIPIAELERMSRWGKAGLRAALILKPKETEI